MPRWNKITSLNSPITPLSLCWNNGIKMHLVKGPTNISILLLNVWTEDTTGQPIFNSSSMYYLLWFKQIKSCWRLQICSNFTFQDMFAGIKIEENSLEQCDILNSFYHHLESILQYCEKVAMIFVYPTILRWAMTIKNRYETRCPVLVG